jgi:DNA polymerase III subunit delta'
VSSALYDDVVGQDRAVAALRAAAVTPVHAYLLVGPPGSGKRAAARSFAAALLCAVAPGVGCGSCRDCTLARAEAHPDLVVFEPEGAFLRVEQADEIVRRANLSPAEGDRQVLLLADFGDVHPQAAPKLLKTVEEPPASTVFVILVEDVPRELVTIASRCVRVDLGPVPVALVASTLVAEGLASPELAADIASVCGGRLDRARLLASDEGFLARRSLWASVPGRLDGTGAAVAAVADELVASMASAAVGPLSERQAAEAAAVEERRSRIGERGSGRKALEDRHKRELRRLRSDELRFGLATVAGVYRAAATTAPATAVAAVAAVEAAAKELVRNPNEALLLQALLLRLSATVIGAPE